MPSRRGALPLGASLAALAVLACEPADARPGTEDPEELTASVTIVRDTYGVPHIYAPTDAGVVFGEAWAQAEDNWWQVEDNFVRAIGRGSELYGQETFVDDYLGRAMEIVGRSIAEYERAPDDIRAMYDAYAAGFNFWLDRHPDDRRLLERVEPWHTLALIRFKYHHNEYIGYAGLGTIQTRRLLQAVGSSAADGVDEALAFRRELTPNGERALGSNEMALAGSRTASGAAMLLINPHVPFFGLSQYREVHVESEEGLVFSGLSRYGFMLPYMGNNRTLGWAYTDNYMDFGDMYVERFDDPDRPLGYRYGESWRDATEWTETLHVLSGGELEARPVTFRKTHHGPILGLDDEGNPLAVRLAKLDEGGWFDQWYRMMRAGSLEEWRRALSVLDVPYMNTMYADRDGNILYIYNAAVPRRDPAYDWGEPVDGSDPGTEWQGYHTLDELPQTQDPATGWLQNTNSDPLRATDGLTATRADFPGYMIGSETHHARAVSASRVLAELEKATLDDFARAVLDTRMSMADEHVPGIVEEFRRAEREAPGYLPAGVRPAVDALAAWDHSASIESEATTLFVEWAQRYLGRDDRFREQDFGRLEALGVAMERLTDDWGTWRVAWGELNRAQRPDASGQAPFSDDLPSVPVAGAPAWLGSVFTYHTQKAPGGRRFYGVHGNSFVKVIEFGPEIGARSILTFGQSGHPDSRHYFDQAETYGSKGFKPAWFSRAEVEANAARTYRPGEGPS